MRRYSIFIVDDEELTTRGLRRYIDWTSLGFSVDGVFTDGAKAIEAMTHSPPDVLLTDIRMIPVSGLDLARHVRVNGLRTLVVFLSAYQDFEYAAKALRLKVHEYLLKPVQPEQIAQCFAAVHRELDRRDEEEIRRTAMEHVREETVRKIKSFITEILRWDGGVEDPAALKLLSIIFPGFDRQHTLWYRVEVIYSPPEEAGPLLRDRLLREVQRIDSNNSSSCHLVTDIDETSLRFFWLTENRYRSVDAVREMVYENLSEAWKGSSVTVESIQVLNAETTIAGVHAGAGAPASDEAEVTDSPVDRTGLDALYAELDHELHCHDIDRAISRVRRIHEHLRVRELHVVQCETIFQLDLIRNNLGARGEPLSIKEYTTVLRSRDRSELSGIVERKLRGIERDPDDTDRTTAIIDTVKTHVGRNIESSLSLTNVAETVGLSPTYLSRLFKAATGQKFIDFLKAVRIERAQVLLKGDVPIKRVASLVGYNDLKHFYTVFKDHTGTTPGEFRRKHAH